MSRLEKATNVAIIVACIFLVGTLIRNYYFNKNSEVGSLPEFTKGTEVKLPLAAASGQPSALPTLVLALSKSCHFCSESVPFYKKLASFKNSSPQKLRLVAVLPDKQEDAEAYVKGNGIGVDAVISMPLANLGVRGTPTLLLLDGQNKIEEFWVGKMTESEEAAVMERLKKVCDNCTISSVSSF
jgi:thioredoxin-related protein